MTDALTASTPSPAFLRLLRNGDNEHDAEIDACADAWGALEGRMFDLCVRLDAAKREMGVMEHLHEVEVTALRNRLEAAEAAVFVFEGDCEVAEARVEVLEKRLEAAEKYAQHLPTCKWNRLGVFVGDAVYGECTCGFAALAGK